MFSQPHFYVLHIQDWERLWLLSPGMVSYHAGLCPHCWSEYEFTVFFHTKAPIGPDFQLSCRSFDWKDQAQTHKPSYLNMVLGTICQILSELRWSNLNCDASKPNRAMAVNVIHMLAV